MSTDVPTLISSLGWWETVGFIAAGIVLLGVIGEFLAEFTDVFKLKQNEKRRTRFAKLSALVLIVGLLGELPSLFKTSHLSGQIINVLNKEANAANKEAAQARKDAADAYGQAAKASLRAEGLAEENTKLRGEIEKATAETHLRTEELKQQNLATETKLSAAETKLEEERKTRLELEKSLAPRVLGFQIGPGDKTSFEELKPFAGTEVIFDVLPDAEARRAAQEIGNVLSFAGWKTVRVNFRADLYTGYFDGVIVEPKRPGMGILANPGDKELAKEIAQEERSRQCAEALVSYLLSKDWKARTNLWHGDQLPANTIRILVGFKPSPFYDPDWVKQMEEKYKKIMQEMKEREKYLPKPPKH
jgi:hypothetical protein